MKYTSKKQVLFAARNLGSTAKTFNPAAKYIVAHASSVFSVPAPHSWARNKSARNDYISNQHTSRLISRYVGLKRLPSYLAALDRHIIATHPAGKEYNKLISMPLFARGFYLSYTLHIPRLSSFVKKSIAAKGTLAENATIADFVYKNTDWGRTRRNHPGKNCLSAQIRTTSYERGRNPWGGKWTHKDYYADYTYIEAPAATTGVRLGYLVDANSKAHTVYISARYIKIGKNAPIKKYALSREVSMPVHTQRRVIESHLPSVLHLDYDRAARELMIIDGLGEQYHLSKVQSPAHAKLQIKDAIRAFRKRRAEILSFKNPEKIWVALEDSYEAGNCKTMTNSFAREYLAQVGATGDICTRADLLLSIRDDSYTRRAVVQAAARYAH